MNIQYWELVLETAHSSMAKKRVQHDRETLFDGASLNNLNVFFNFL